MTPTPTLSLLARMAPDPYAREDRGLFAALDCRPGGCCAWVEDPRGVRLCGQSFVGRAPALSALSWFLRTVLSGAAGGLPGDRPLSRVRLDRLRHAADIVARVRANVEDWYADRIDVDVFRARARSAWAPANEDRCLLGVTRAILRGDWADAVALTDRRRR